MNTQSNYPNYYQFGPDKQQEFLDFLVDVGDVGEACDLAQVRKSSVEALRREDSAFREAWIKAASQVVVNRLNASLGRH